MGDRFFIRENLDQSVVDSLYVGFPHLFSIKLHHGGSFTKFPGRTYQRPVETLVDMLDVDKFSVHELDTVLEYLGYDKEATRYYHYLYPNGDLDFGIRALGGDEDVREFSKHVAVHKLMFVYVEHGATNVHTYFCSPAKITIREVNDEELLANERFNEGQKRLLLGWHESTVENEQSTNQQEEIDYLLDDTDFDPFFGNVVDETQTQQNVGIEQNVVVNLNMNDTMEVNDTNEVNASLNLNEPLNYLDYDMDFDFDLNMNYYGNDNVGDQDGNQGGNEDGNQADNEECNERDSSEDDSSEDGDVEGNNNGNQNGNEEVSEAGSETSSDFMPQSSDPNDNVDMRDYRLHTDVDVGENYDPIEGLFHPELEDEVRDYRLHQDFLESMMFSTLLTSHKSNTPLPICRLKGRKKGVEVTKP
ncbi:hypothetical protein QVD17_26518 [Tagetes erecta]|uniref:PB1-like domain-containing protein n=1 Tax=Tagetes erecta TaxID=13708 RepID=A0AAD8NQW7_TARER|nr:hypothetical protein QVD17_26518 [Tagetes erecta]